MRRSNAKLQMQYRTNQSIRKSLSLHYKLMKRPNIFLYSILGFLVKIFAYFKGQRITKKLKISGPAIILSNHTSFYDFIYTTAAMYPHRVSYLAANKMFYDPLLGFFLHLARAIPKSLFQSDPAATLKAFKILKRKG